MSRMPGRGVGPGAIVTGSGFRYSGIRSRASRIGQRRHWDRQRVAAERQHPVERATELRTEAVEPLVRDRHEAVDFDQVDGTPGMLAGGKEGAVQPQRRENAEDSAAADVRRQFHREKRAIRTGRLLRPAPDRERIGAVAAGVAASAERQAGDDPRGVVILGHELTPPGIGLALLRHRQHADRGLAFADRADYLTGRAVSRHRRVAAVVVARQIPKALRFGRSKDRDGKRRLQPHRRREHLAPHPNEGCHRQVPAVRIDKAADDLSLPGRLESGESAVPLARRHHRDDLRPFDQKVVHLVIDLIEAVAQLCEIGRGGGHGLVCSKGLIVLETGPGEIKENVDMAHLRSLPSAPSSRTGGRDLRSAVGRPATTSVEMSTLISQRLRSRPDQEWPGHRLLMHEPLRLDCGGAFGPFYSACHTYGTLNPDRTNAILVCHALTGDQYGADPHPITDKPGWWETMV